jgi:hypothetical protein
MPARGTHKKRNMGYLYKEQHKLMSPPFGLKEPCILEKAIKPHPKRMAFRGPRKKEELGIYRRSNTS